MNPAMESSGSDASSRHTHALAARPWETGHDVQFYDDDVVLAHSVAKFLADGIRRAQPAILIATPSHRRAFLKELRAMGIDVDVLGSMDLLLLDARDTLASFMEGGRPNAELFAATVGNVFEKVISNRRYVTLRAYGEMVDLLWREGKQNAAIELEELWNELATKYSFALLCAYAKEGFGDHGDPDGVARICGVHTRVLPSRPVP